jgi:hypothetical protein
VEHTHIYIIYIHIFHERPAAQPMRSSLGDLHHWTAHRKYGAHSFRRAARVHPHYIYTYITREHTYTGLPTQLLVPSRFHTTARGVRWYRYSNRHTRGKPRVQVAFKDLMIRGICNSHYVSHFAAFFIVAGAKRSIVKSCVFNYGFCLRNI